MIKEFKAYGWKKLGFLGDHYYTSDYNSVIGAQAKGFSTGADSTNLNIQGYCVPESGAAECGATKPIWRFYNPTGKGLLLHFLKPKSPVSKVDPPAPYTIVIEI